MWPLLFFSVLTISIVIERFIMIFLYSRLSVKNIYEDVKELVKKGDFKTAIEYCKNCSKRIIGAPIIKIMPRDV